LGQAIKVDLYLFSYSKYYNDITEVITYKSQLVPGTCACPLLIPSSRVLMLHKSSIYCPRQMSFSSLIFSMRAISMKVNLALVSILIIPLYWLYICTCPLIFSHHIGSGVFWTWAHIVALTPSLWGVFVRCHGAVWTWAHIMALTSSL